MASHGHHAHAFSLLAMKMGKRLRLSFSNQSLPFLRDLSLIWFMDHFDQRLWLNMTDSSLLHCRSFLVMSIQWTCVLLPCRRFVSGAFSRRRWIFRLSTGDCPLTRWYGGFTWVFDPGINRVLAEDEDILKLVIPIYLLETKKNSQVQWITSRGPVPLFVFREDEGYDSDISVSNRKTNQSSKLVRLIRREVIHKTTGSILGVFAKDANTSTFVISSLQDHDNFERLYFIFNKSASGLRLHHFCYYSIEFLRLHIHMSKYWCDNFNKSWQYKKESILTSEMYDRLLVVVTNNSWWVRIERIQKSNNFRMPLGLCYFEDDNFLLSMIRYDDDDVLLSFWSIMITIAFTSHFVIASKVLDLLVSRNIFWYRQRHLWRRISQFFHINWKTIWTQMRGFLFPVVLKFKKHGLEPFQTTFHNFLSIKVMRKAFRSFIYKMIACYECMKRGLNRFILLPVSRLLLESRVTSTSSSKLGFNFLYLFQWLYLNGFMYHVSRKTFMK